MSNAPSKAEIEALVKRHGDQGYGDYIIFKVDESGLIQGWKVPEVDPDEWE